MVHARGPEIRLSLEGPANIVYPMAVIDRELDNAKAKGERYKAKWSRADDCAKAKVER